MAQVLDTIMVCEDCVQAIANDDYSGLDYHYSEPESTQRMEAIQAGIAGLGGYAVIGDEAGFSHRGCGCCGSNLGGNRHECSVLS